MGEKIIEVWLRRDTDGEIYSTVIDTNDLRPNLEDMCSIVIDRVKGRHMDANTVKMRAKSLARVLGCELVENYDWPCGAIKKLPCKCPKCISDGC